MSGHDQKPLESKVETVGDRPKTYVRYPCACGWRGAWWTTPMSALTSHAAHVRTSAPAPSVEPALTPLLRALRREFACDECGSTGRCHPSCSLSAGARR